MAIMPLYGYLVQDGMITPPVLETNDEEAGEYVLLGYVISPNWYDPKRTVYTDGEFVDVPPIDPTDTPPPPPTAEEIMRGKILALNMEYLPQLQAVKDDILTAIAKGDTTLLEELRTEYAELETEYNEKMAVIMNG